MNRPERAGRGLAVLSLAMPDRMVYFLPVHRELRMKNFACVVLLLASRALAQDHELLRHWDYDQGATLNIKQTGIEERDGVTIHDITYSSPVGDRGAAVGPNGG